MSSKKNNKIKNNTIESNDDIDDEDKDINNLDDDYSDNDYDKSDNEDNNIMDDEDDDDFEPDNLEYSLIDDDDDNDIKEINKITRPFLTKYEKVKLLATRTNQLARGAKPMIKNVDYSITPKDLAKLELKEKVIPLIVLRPIPNGKSERWKITEFKNI